MPDQRYLTRVRALLAKAESTDYPDEAEALAAKAAELMARHGIEAAMVAETGQAVDQIITRRIDLTDPYSSEKGTLLAAVAAAFDCRSVKYRVKGARTCGYSMLVGHQADVEQVELIYTSLLLQAGRAVLRQRPSAADRREGFGTRAFRRAWMLGYAMRIDQRFQEIRAAAVAEADTATPGTALVLVDRRAKVDNFMADHFPNAYQPKVAPVSANGYERGKAAADFADLGQTGIRNARAALR